MFYTKNQKLLFVAILIFSHVVVVDLRSGFTERTQCG